MLVKIVLGLVVLIALILIVAAFQPADYRVERSATISAPPAAVFAQFNDLHAWLKISPYAKLDPAAKYIFAGPDSGPGATLAWSGNTQAGEGRMTITESRPAEFVAMRLEFVKPFPSTASVEFTFQANGGQTTATWVMKGQKVFMMKVAGLFMNLDRMLGAQFEEGLANVKAVAEAPAKPVQP